MEQKKELETLLPIGLIANHLKGILLMQPFHAGSCATFKGLINRPGPVLPNFAMSEGF
jgi:hypothetical protein